MMKRKFFKLITLILSAAFLAAGLAACDDRGTTTGGGDDGTDDDDTSIALLSFYAVNDLHGKFMDSEDQPGTDELTTYFKDLYADPAREEILLSSGDMWQGTVESSTNRGALMTEWMNELDFVSMTLGNHEYDWGADALLPNSESAEFPFLAINVTDGGVMPAYCKASTVVEKAGVKIGIIGAIGDCLSSISGEFQGGLQFATDDALTKMVKKEATRLRDEEDCDFIVYSIHEGFEDTYASKDVHDVEQAQIPYYDVSLSDGYVDLVFEAHTHQRYILRDEHGVYHLQGGGENDAVSCADVVFDRETKNYKVTPKLIANDVYGRADIDDDPIVETLYDKYCADDPYANVIARLPYTMSSSDVYNVLPELYYEAGMAQWGETQPNEIVLAGGFLRLRSPYKLYAGQVTYADIFSVLPFDNAIILGRISGRYLKSQFLNSTNRDYHIYAPSISASSVSESKTYYIVVDSYTAYYKYNHITEIARLDGKRYARDLLADYLHKTYDPS